MGGSPTDSLDEVRGVRPRDRDDNLGPLLHRPEPGWPSDARRVLFRSTARNGACDLANRRGDLQVLYLASSSEHRGRYPVPRVPDSAPIGVEDALDPVG